MDSRQDDSGHCSVQGHGDIRHSFQKPEVKGTGASPDFCTFDGLHTKPMLKVNLII